MLSQELMRELDLLIDEELPEEQLEDCDLPDPIFMRDCATEKSHISASVRSGNGSMVSDLIKENLSLKQQLDSDYRFSVFCRRFLSPIVLTMHVFSVGGLLCWAALFCKVGYAVIQLVILLVDISNS